MQYAAKEYRAMDTFMNLKSVYDDEFEIEFEILSPVSLADISGVRRRNSAFPGTVNFPLRNGIGALNSG